jgi:hypothetical protein
MVISWIYPESARSPSRYLAIKIWWHWESLGNLGVVKTDAVGIAYAIEKGWLIISGGLHSESLTEAGWRRLK